MTTTIRAMEKSYSDTIWDNGTCGTVAMVGVFISGIVFALMLAVIVKAMKRAWFKSMGFDMSKDEMERFKEYREMWNTAAKACIGTQKSCDELEKVLGKTKDEPRKGGKRVVVKRAKSDESDPCMPDNEEWGEW